MLTIGFVLFPDLTTLDLVGPHEVLVRTGAELFLVAKKAGPVPCSGGLQLVADVGIEDCPPLDVLVVPGGPGQTPAMEDEALLEFIDLQSASAQWTVGVCTGTLLLAAAGRLKGRRATTHWLALKELERLGAIPVAERIVWDENILTGAGVSSGIDVALELVGRMLTPEDAERIQLSIEYDPMPPFDAGSPQKARPELVEELRSTSRFPQG